MGRRISIANKLAMIAAGYGRTVGGGIMAGAVNKLRLPDHIQRPHLARLKIPSLKLRRDWHQNHRAVIAEGKSRVVLTSRGFPELFQRQSFARIRRAGLGLSSAVFSSIWEFRVAPIRSERQPCLPYDQSLETR